MSTNRNINDNNDPAHNFGNNDIPSNGEVYKCIKCGGNDTESCELQTRLADIPTSIFITCKTCGCNWKM